VREQAEGTPFPWLVISSAFAVTIAIVILKESGASDVNTDFLSMSILIAALALASTLNRRTGLMVAILAGIIAAIVPGSTSFTAAPLWDGVFRVCFLVAMSMSFYRVISALRDREDHLQRQLANLQRLQEEVTTLHSLTVRAPTDRESAYQEIARGALRLGGGTRSRLMLRNPQGGRWMLASQWPPFQESEMHPHAPVVPETAGSDLYRIAADGDGRETITIPLSAGEYLEGALQLDRDAKTKGGHEDAQLLAIYARDATLTLDHIALQRQLEHFAIIGERGRIARELHDGLVQSLAGVAFHLEYYRDALGPEATMVRAGFERMTQEVKSALHEARSMIHELRSEPRLENLCAALGDLVDQVTVKTDLPITADITRVVPPISHAQAGALLQIAQEALQNVVKHAAANHVCLHLAVVADRVVLRIVDNGCGFVFPPEEIADRSVHFGLIGMKERANMNGGNLLVESSVGKGTTVQLVFPIAGEETSA